MYFQTFIGNEDKTTPVYAAIGYEVKARCIRIRPTITYTGTKASMRLSVLACYKKGNKMKTIENSRYADQNNSIVIRLHR